MFREARRRRRPTLSVIVGAHRPGPLVASCIGALREVADEIIIGADERVGESDLAWYGSVADDLVTFPFLGPNQHRGWLRPRATGDWILFFDDDEIPSQALLDGLPDMLDDRMLAAYRLPVWWVAPDGRGILDDRPWSWSASGYLPRLVRNDDRLWFPSRKHTGAQTSGATKRVEHGFLHLALAVDDHASRVAKVARYDGQQFGLLTEGRPTNEAYYLPESRDVPPNVRPLTPDDERRVIAALTADGPPPRRSRAVSARATAADIRRFVPWTPFDDHDARAQIEVLHVPATVPAGTTFDVDLAVSNLGTRTWPSGADQEPAVRVSYHWFVDGGLDVMDGHRTLLPHPLRPGERTVLTCVVEAPEARPGTRRTVGFDVLAEHDRWFDCMAAVDVEVTAAPRDRLLAACRGDWVPLSEVLALRADMTGHDPLSRVMLDADPSEGSDDAEDSGAPERVFPSAISEAVAGLPVGEWALDHVALLEIIRRYEQHHPDVVVEFGSGTSTVLLAALAQHHGRHGVSVVSVEQDDGEAERVRALLSERGLDSFVDIVVAPLTEVDHGGVTLLCYDPDVVGQALTDRPPSMVLVDGPSQVTGGNRFPTLLMVQPHAAADAVFLVDDAWRDKELVAAERWSVCPGIEVHGIIPLPKGMLIGTLRPE